MHRRAVPADHSTRSAGADRYGGYGGARPRLVGCGGVWLDNLSGDAVGILSRSRPRVKRHTLEPKQVAFHRNALSRAVHSNLLSIARYGFGLPGKSQQLVMNLAPENVCGNRQASPDSTDRKEHTQREFHGWHRDLARIVKVRRCEFQQTENCLGHAGKSASTRQL